MSKEVTMNYKNDEEREQLVDEMFKGVHIRESDDGTVRAATSEENEMARQVISSALATANYRNQNLDEEHFSVSADTLQVIKDMAEITIDNMIPDCNGYESVYIPLTEAFEQWEKESLTKEAEQSRA